MLAASWKRQEAAAMGKLVSLHPLQAPVMRVAPTHLDEGRMRGALWALLLLRSRGVETGPAPWDATWTTTRPSMRKLQTSH